MAEHGGCTLIGCRGGPPRPYCRDPVDDPVGEVCPACGAPQHEACMIEHGGCTILGCQGGPERVRAR